LFRLEGTGGPVRFSLKHLNARKQEIEFARSKNYEEDWPGQFDSYLERIEKIISKYNSL